MAALLMWRDPSGLSTKFPLFKSLTTLGCDDAADIKLDDSKIENIVAHISQKNGVFTITSLGAKTRVFVQGQRIYSCILAGNEEIRIGIHTFVFDKEAKAAQVKTDYEDNRDLIAYQRLLEFSRKLAKESDVNCLLNVLLDEIIEVVKAEKGFLVLLNGLSPAVTVARHFGRSAMPEAIEDLSDSILRKVIATREPVVVRDAAHDQEFKASVSVINFQLSSVMCVPLNTQGKFFGAIYVANNSLTNVFDRQSLEIMLVFASQAALILQSSLNVDQLSRQAEALKSSLRIGAVSGIIGNCAGMVKIFSQIERIASTNANVLIFGESGTGKRLIAQELHRRSSLSTKPLISVHCGAMPEELMEIELFGCLRGVNPSATHSRPGKLHQANGGTILLEEVGDLPLFLQMKLLTSLKSGRISRVGESESQKLQVRILASDCRNLEHMVKNYAFHEGLFYLLGTVQINLPPLSDRGNDVLVMANYFLQQQAKIFNKQISGLTEDAQNAMLNYTWPGNIRQLESKMKRAVIMATAGLITASDLEFDTTEFSSVASLSAAVDQFRQRYIREALERNAGNRTKAALELKVDPRTIFRHLENEKNEAQD